MPETCFPIRTRPQVRWRSPGPALLLISMILGGCSGGDFGRTRQDFRNDDMHSWLGAEATGSIGLKASQFQLTDNERQLRDLADGREQPDRAVGPAMPGAADLVLSLGAGAAGDPGAG